MVRNTFGLVFTLGLVAVFLIVAGLLGYAPPAHLSLDAATWRRGTWSDTILVGQVALGLGLLTVAALTARRLNRRLRTRG